jgi:DNA-binding TFAR19-related protein (PDSD5 family)
MTVARIILVKPDKARGLEAVILRAAQMGQITKKVLRLLSNIMIFLIVFGSLFSKSK